MPDPAGPRARLRRVNRLVDLPARWALVGAVVGVVAAMLAGAVEPDQVVLGCAVLGVMVGCRCARRSMAAEPLVQLLLSLALVRFGIGELSDEPVVAGLALGVAVVLIAAIVGSRLLRRRRRGMAAGR